MFFHHSQRASVLTSTSIITLTILTLTLFGCRPPENGVAYQGSKEGRAIVNVTPQEVPKFKTVNKNGVDYIEARGEVGEFGGTFTEASIGTGPRTFNGWASNDAESSRLSNMMFAGLITVDAYSGLVTPYLAKDIDIKPDNKTYIVTLRRGLKWSDGKPLTSADVVYTWNTIIKNGYGNASTRDVNTIDGKFPVVKALDRYRIKFVTPKPFAPFLQNLGTEIAPKHIMEPVTKKDGNASFSSFWGTSDATSNPQGFIASGMWLLEKYEQGQRVIFKRNPNFFMLDKKGQQLPYLDKYVINYVGDMNNQQLQFEQGKSDVYPVPGKNVSLVRRMKEPEFSIYNLGPTSSTSFLTFNHNTRKDPESAKHFVKPYQSKWFTSKNFKKAVDYALNRDDMVANILNGIGEPLFTAESLSSIYLNEKLTKGHNRDLDKARAFLKADGFYWKEGKLFDTDHHRVSFSLYTNTGNDQREATGVSIQQDLSEIGINVDFKPMDFNVLIGKIQQGHWEAIILGLTGSTLEPNSGMNVWKSDGSLHLFNQRDVSTDNPVDLSDRFDWETKIDDIYNKGATTIGFENRKPIYDRYQEIAYEHLPFLYLYSPLSITAVRDRIQNFNPTPLGTFHNLEEIWIKE